MVKFEHFPVQAQDWVNWQYACVCAVHNMVVRGSAHAMQAQVDRVDAQLQQMAEDINHLKLAHLAVSPADQDAKLHWHRFCGLSQMSKQIVGQAGQLSHLQNMVVDASNKRNVYMIYGAPGMVRLRCSFAQQ